MRNKYNNKSIPAIIIPTGKTVNLCDFINMVLEFEDKPKEGELRGKQTPPKKDDDFESGDMEENKNE